MLELGEGGDQNIIRIDQIENRSTEWIAQTKSHPYKIVEFEGCPNCLLWYILGSYRDLAISRGEIDGRGKLRVCSIIRIVLNERNVARVRNRLSINLLSIVETKWSGDDQQLLKDLHIPCFSTCSNSFRTTANSWGDKGRTFGKFGMWC